MIVFTKVNENPIHAMPGDKFQLTVIDQFHYKVIIEEEVTVKKTIDFVASFRFALEDGTCPGFHLTGVFASKNELPKELRDGIKFEDLSKEQKDNFRKSVGIKIKEDK